MPLLYRTIRAAGRFDALAPGSGGEWWCRLRVVRTRLPEGGWLSLVTDLPRSEFSVSDLAELRRWEGSNCRNMPSGPYPRPHRRFSISSSPAYLNATSESKTAWSPSESFPSASRFIVSVTFA